MTTILNASNSAGLVATADTSAILQLQTANTAAMTITAAQLVGLGTASPTVQLLNIAGTSVSGPTNNPVGVQLTDNGFSLSSQIVNRAGNTLYNVPSTKSHSFQINSTESVAMYANGIGLGGAIPSSGTGITFPATQSASSDANTLDDYEEGTWTPSIGGTATYNAGNIGRYTKIGRLVVVSAIIQINQRGTGSQTRVSGLPFTVAINGQGSIGYYDSIATSLIFIQPYTDTNSDTSVNFRTLTAASTSMGDANIFQNGTRVDFTVVYFSA